MNLIRFSLCVVLVACHDGYINCYERFSTSITLCGCVHVPTSVNRLLGAPTGKWSRSRDEKERRREKAKTKQSRNGANRR